MTGFRRILLIGALTIVAAACGGEEDDGAFTALDAEDMAAIVDGALTEESGLKGVITADQLSQGDVDQLNATARRLCNDLADGVSGEEARAFQAETAEAITGLEDLLDAVGMVRAVIEATCPANLATYDGTTGG